MSKKYILLLAWMLCACPRTGEMVAPPEPELSKTAPVSEAVFEHAPEIAFIGHMWDSYVTVLDVPTMAEVTRIAVPAASAPNIVLAPNERHGFITHQGPSGVSKADLSNYAILKTTLLPRDSQPLDIAITPNGKRIFVTLLQDHAVAALDAETMTTLAVIPLTDEYDYPSGIVIGSDGKYAFAASLNSGRVHVVKVESLQLVETIETGFTGVSELVLSRDGKLVIGAATQQIIVIDARTFDIAAEIQLDYSPRCVQISIDGSEIVTVGGHFLSIIDAKSLLLVKTLELPHGQQQIGLNRSGRLAMTTGLKVTLVDLVNQAVLTTTDLGGDRSWGVMFGKPKGFVPRN